MNIQPFNVNISQATLDDLHERLARTRWPDEVEEAGWDYGTNLAYLKSLVAYWQHQFDWRAQEAKLNQMIYWVTQTIRSSFGYYRDMNTPKLQPGQHIEVPAGFARFPKDIPGIDPPRELAERHLRIARWTQMPRGGHFAALEEPELLVEDLRAFFRPLR
jgi:microsomal epoxide hydrolase